MTDLLEWLRAQIDEDEREANELAEALSEGTIAHSAPRAIPYGATATDDIVQRYNLMSRYRLDPARVLREVQAKRERLRFVEQILGEPPRPEHGEYKLIRDGAMMACAFRLMRIEVLPYSDRPGYREEWRR